MAGCAPRVGLLLKLFAICVILEWPGAAMALPLPDGGVTASELVKVLQDKGYKAEATDARGGGTIIHSAANGANFQIYFYECSGKPRCASFQFASGFGETNITPAKVADWNRTRRFGRVYLDDNDDPWVEMDIDVAHGATTEALGNDLERWIVTLTEFMKYIGR